MSTGLTFGTVSSFYGLRAGILNEAQFSVLVTVVILSAVLPTMVAERFFQPIHYVKANDGPAAGEPAAKTISLLDQEEG